MTQYISSGGIYTRVVGVELFHLVSHTVSKGGARDLKVGGTICERNEQKFFLYPPLFVHWGVQLGTKHGKSSQILLRDSHANSINVQEQSSKRQQS